MIIILLTSIGLIFGVLFLLVRPNHPNNARLMGHIFGKIFIKIMGIDLIIEGENNLNKVHNGAVIISNHQNTCDIFIYGSIAPPRAVSIGKKALLKIPVFGVLYALSGNILIDRSNSKRAAKSLAVAAQKIKEKKLWVWIMPEGTRSYGRGLLPFKQGAFQLAINSQVPLVPFCFSNYHSKLDFNKFKSGKVIARILDPISVDGLTISDSKALMAKAYTSMKTTIEELDNRNSV